MDQFGWGRAGVAEHMDPIAGRFGGQRRVGDAVLGHHAAKVEVGDARL